jgi:hypothetical protein
MSGGGLNHLQDKTDTELLESVVQDNLEHAKQELEQRGYNDAAAATEAIRAELFSMQARLAELVPQELRDVWQAIDYTITGNCSENDVADKMKIFRQSTNRRD